MRPFQVYLLMSFKLINNYEITKLCEENVYFSFTFIYLALLIITCLLSKKKERDLLSRDVTNELKGIGILFVIIGHLAIHVIEPKNYYLAFSDFGVSIFFMLSGFGLSRSYFSKPMKLKSFILRRLTKVLIPYWIATLFIVIIDYQILNRQYSTIDLTLTMVGVNFSATTRHIDYVRWYITALILWYAIFAICWKHFQKNSLSILMPVLGFILFLINYYILHLGYAFLSFPLGVVLGIKFDFVRDKLEEIDSNYIHLIVLIGLIIPYTFMRFIVPDVTNLMPYIIIELLKEVSWIIFSFSLAILLSRCTLYVSNFLVFFGVYSYELFLFHGAFMIKYDLVLFRGPFFFTFWPYLISMIIISIIFKKLVFIRLQ